MRFKFDNGKYEIDREGVSVKAFRYGEPWPAGAEQFTGNNLLHAMLDTIESFHIEQETIAWHEQSSASS